jgi:molybdate transport system substrate-binding protein
VSAAGACARYWATQAGNSHEILTDDGMGLRHRARASKAAATLTRRRLGALLLGLGLECIAFVPNRLTADGALAASQDPAKPPIVFAAASMKTALDAVAEAWKAGSGKTVTIAYGSSATLAKQIEQGAPADIFISADLKWMDYLDQAKLLKAGTRRNRLGNKLVLIEPSDAKSKLEIAKGFDLAGATADGKIAVCEIDSCPGGLYAKEALEWLGVFGSVEPKLAQTGNIRSALSLVSRGEARFGIVYATDARSDPKVRVVGIFPALSHSPIVYPVALTAASQNPDAPFFLAYLTSQAATRIFLDQGFAILSK